jgi:hypothetical protein
MDCFCLLNGFNISMNHKGKVNPGLLRVTDASGWTGKRALKNVIEPGLNWAFEPARFFL